MGISRFIHFDSDGILSLAKVFSQICASICCLAITYFYVRGTSVKDLSLWHNDSKKKALFVYESIGSGALTLNPHLFYRSVPSLLQEVAFIKKDLVPGEIKSASFLFGIKNSGQILSVLPGEEIFLEVDEKDPGLPLLRVSNNKSSFSIKPVLSEKEGILVEARLLTESEKVQEIDLLIKEISFNEFNKEALIEFEKSKPVKLLALAKCWTKDFLYEEYGGKIYSSYKNANKVEISDGIKSFFYLVKEGDIFFFDNEKWARCDDDACSLGFIRAQALAVNDQGVRFKIWDKEGYTTTYAVINAQKNSSSSLKEETLPKAAKLRSPSKVSCVVGKKRVLMKKGDWLLKTPSGWRILKTSQDIQDCLDHKIKGSLLILDEVQMQQGKALLTGHLFNEMRTDVQEVKINVEVPQKAKKIRNHTKKSARNGAVG